MPFQIVKGDITKIRCDAIVNAANNSLLGGGGVDGAIHMAAGPGLLSECRTLGGCETGDAKITKGYDLPAKYVIHTVGPVYADGEHGEEALLRSCYRKSLALAAAHGCESVAFPMISAGVYGYPWDDALNVAESEIISFLEDHDMTVYLVIYSGRARRSPRRDDIALQAYLAERLDRGRTREEKHVLFSKKERKKRSDSTVWYGQAPSAGAGHSLMEERLEEPLPEINAVCAPQQAMDSLDRPQWVLDESFSEMLLRKIDESGMTDAQCYKKANVDKRLFSKIRSNTRYQPKKQTALAFAVALRLDVGETGELLKKAGFALSDSNLFDVIVRYYIERGEYDIFRINEVLFDHDQPLLGSVA